MAIYHYLTIAAPAEGAYQESASKFLTYVAPVSSKEAFTAYLLEIKALHPRANHHCYAYRIIEGNEITEYASDAGEPSGSAGQPILGELRRNALVQICAIVVRYFGGTKLGIPGLIHAYRESTAVGLAMSTVITAEKQSRYRVSMPHGLQPHVYNACKRLEMELIEAEYGARFSATLVMPSEHETARIDQLLSYVSGMQGDAAHLLARLEMTMEKLPD